MSPNPKIQENIKYRERIFILCEDCMWSVTSLDKSRLFELVGVDGNCPLCHQDELSSFPLLSNEPLGYHYLEKNGIEVQFSNRRSIKQISEIETA